MFHCLHYFYLSNPVILFLCFFFLISQDWLWFYFLTSVESEAVKSFKSPVSGYPAAAFSPISWAVGVVASQPFQVVQNQFSVCKCYLEAQRQLWEKKQFRINMGHSSYSLLHEDVTSSVLPDVNVNWFSSSFPGWSIFLKLCYWMVRKHRKNVLGAWRRRKRKLQNMKRMVPLWTEKKKVP